MAKGKKPKRRARKIVAVPILALPLILNPCVARDEKKEIEDRHSERRQYRATPELVGQALNAANANVTTSTTVSTFFSLNNSPFWSQEN
jgi:hypothetical protein